METPHDSGQAGALEIEITPAMIEAGAYAAREYALGSSLEDLAYRVFSAMLAEIEHSFQPPPQAL